MPRDPRGAQASSFSAYTSGSPTYLASFSSTSGSLYDGTTQANPVSYAGASFPTETASLFGQLTGTTSVPIVNGVAVFDELAVTGQKFPVGGVAHSAIGFGLIDQTHAAMEAWSGPPSALFGVKP